MNAAAPLPSRRSKNFGVSRFAAAAEGQLVGAPPPT
jgi:hypothetical protein